jgi:hypothetical protein
VADVMTARGSGQELDITARPFVEEMAIKEDRVVLRCRPWATIASSRATTTRKNNSLAGRRPPCRGTRRIPPEKATARIMDTTSPQQDQQLRSAIKVPEVTAASWVTKAPTTGMGERVGLAAGWTT